ncbi:Major facilitator superfamily domain, general substrate transporter [Plasmopara halstedii]|uniref:Major facilitator superfamily domain, general substrate transporter n=1 Tax=Plasmopara halstedii TaxID=4781 RepID=A0A0P1ALP1_PLAHL|nr:Major facilitator superfamily domain, general substrate transporter [Plasmopara halstedii]CEG42066.1 Major facilitator superfamily domain, general substrate transporter [Plasmopara halstedii]|eukprot:XP_024578435.1 Major facilitator superfamily domain, general substrate transporter [Plasmopara halstedii]
MTLINLLRSQRFELKTDEILIIDLAGHLRRTPIRTSNLMDFKHLQSPSFETRNEEVRSLQAVSVIRDAERSINSCELNHPNFNGDVYASLRKGGAVNFFSRYCIGLVAATFSSTFSVGCLYSAIQPMLQRHVNFTTNQIAASERLTSMPLILSFVFGLLSDCYPIMGSRRKGYTLVGLVTAVVSIWILAALNAYAASYETGKAGVGIAVLVILFGALTSLGNILMYVSTHTRVIELAQREPLGLRGSILATYLIFRCIVYIITDLCIHFSRVSATANSAHQTTTLIVFGVIIALPMPLIIHYWDEKCYSLSTSVKCRSQILWKIMQQKASWSILLFLCFFTLFNQISFSGPVLVISVWAGANEDSFLMQQSMYYGAMIVTMFVWRSYFMNRSWRAFYLACPVLLIVPQLIVSILVSQDIVRNRVFYRIMTLFSSVSAAIGWLGSIVPLTEIVHEGSEGAIVGLSLSFYFLVMIFVQTNSVGLFEGSNFYDVNEVAADTHEGRQGVLKSLMLNYGLNAMSIIGLYFLPRQKLDTQQLRCYGGYTKCASSAIVTFAVILFIYSFVVTIMTFIPEKACLRLIGGTGC